MAERVTSFYIANGMGDAVDGPSDEEMRAFLEAIDANDDEHGAAWLTIDEGDRSLEWNGDGRLVYGVGSNESRHITGVDRDKALSLWGALVRGELDVIEREPWAPGAGYVRTPEQEAELAAWHAAQERAFYDSLGPENPASRCRQQGCTRGAITHSVFCRVHHYEMMRGGAPSPFDH